ncbi:uncharacterized protein [Diadema setosum]|uniref:uncharacterized protein n=1 Tax=Diadema setosum TaxID=31175 RepID=UPI003B3A2E1E
MEYNYLQERAADHRTNPETSQSLHQPQHPVHYQHQQYPTPHHSIQAGYPGLRFASYINPLQGPGAVPGHVPSADGVPLSRVATSSAGGSGISSQGTHEFDSVLNNVMPGASTPLHFRPVHPNSQHALPHHQNPTSSSTVVTPTPQQALPSDSNSDLSYQIQDLSNSTQSRTNVSSNNMNMANSVAGGCISSSVIPAPHQASQSNAKKKTTNSAPRQKPKKPGLPEPVVQIVEPQVQPRKPKSPLPIIATKSCQTEPMFEDLRPTSSPQSAPPDLPDGLRYVEASQDGKGVSGVVATRVIEAGREFGPFTGEFVKESLGCYNPTTWEVCVRGHTWFYLDGACDPNNWMRHVQTARKGSEQNVEAFQFYGDIFFRTTKSVEAGTQLMVFYSKDYLKHVGFKTELDELCYKKDSHIFECDRCACRYTNPKSLLRHNLFEHERENTSKGPNKEILQQVLEQKDISQTQNLADKYAHLLNMREFEAKKSREQREERAKMREKVKENKSSRNIMKVKFVPLKKSAGRQCAPKTEEPSDEFQCKKCGKSFTTQGRLREHSAFHQEMNKLKPICDICGLECKHSRALKQHKLSHDPDSFQCQYCKKYFRRKGCLVYHLRHDHEVFVGEKWMRGNLVDQMARYVGPGEPEEEPFHPDLPTDMLGKRILVSGKRPKVFKCKFCPKKFRAHHLVLKHEKIVHIKSGRFKCEYCSKVFMEEYRYMLHLRSHTKDRPFKCSECPQSFASESALANHQPAHRGERPFKCEVCGKAFRTRKYATTHKRRQHTEPSVLWQCSFCDKTFKDKTGLVRHERCHKGIRPHVCLTCGKAFGTKYTLQSHMHVHTGEKPFKCNVCGQRFGLNHHLTTHMIRHQKSKPADLVIAVMQRDATSVSTSGGNSEDSNQDKQLQSN